MSNITGSFYTSNSNLENLIPSQADITDISQRITGITYDGITDTTIIDNNVTITAPHVLTVNGMNVYESINNNTTAISTLNGRVTGVETILTDISYNSTTDTTSINNNVVIGSGKILTLNGGDVDAQLTALEDKTQGISYDFTFDTTTVSNNLTIQAGKQLVIGSTNIGTAVSGLTTITTGMSYIPGTDTTSFDNNMILTTGKSLTLNGQNVNSRFNSIETRITGINYAGTTTTISNPTIVLNGLIDISGNNIEDVGNIYINAGGNIYIGNSPINTAALLVTNNSWTGTNDFTANDTRVSTQTVPSLTTLVASCRFVQDSLDWFTSTNQIYTNSAAFQNFQATNITCATQTTADNSKKVANSEYVNSKFTQFRTDNQTMAGVVTFSQPPVSTTMLPLLEKSTKMPNSNWVLSNVSGESFCCGE